ncbi:DEAD/DEAH box helicase [Streptomyces uncialis]|uniref:DEAD/DEAH box helicase n=1 Tax=Streptomyces uncialis TaxID=1048205 RepID=UPI0036527BFB
MPLTDAPEPPTGGSGEEILTPRRWDISDKDWQDLRDALSLRYDSEASRLEMLRGLEFPGDRMPAAANLVGDFWERIRTQAEEGAVDWDWRKLVEHALREPGYREVLGRLAAGSGTPDSPDTVLVTLDEPLASPDAPPPPVRPEAAPRPRIRAYTDLLPPGKRPDHRSALLDLWERKLGPWDELKDFQRDLLRLCRTILDSRGVGLVYAVTNSGKTTLARAGMTMAVDGGSTAMMLLPIKALVTQEKAEWDGWRKDERLSGMRVYPASRDYPEYDRPVSGGNFDVALAIYEKLGVYLVNGLQPLKNNGLLVVDELQMLVEKSERAAKLEALLTLVRMLPQEDRPALLGLSAALSQEAGKTLEHWLGARRSLETLSTNERPVPLDTYVVDQKKWLVQRDAHLLSMPGEAKPPEPYEEKHELDKIRDQHGTVISHQLRDLGSGLSTAALAAVLVIRTLRESDSRRVIVFVPSRTAAQDLSLAIQEAWQAERRLGRVSPWQSGRFANGGSRARDAEGKLYRRLRGSDLPLQDIVIRGLKHGVAPHTAALAPPLRRMLEEEFRAPDGLLRVLVATDTLAVGLNLPADVVIATSVAGWSGSGSNRVRQILPPADLDNKGGRAGRRLSREEGNKRGQFYILVPTEHDLQEIEGLGTEEIQQLSTAAGVVKRFVTSKFRSVKVRSQFRDQLSISGLVLQVLCQDRRKLTRRQWLNRVSDILGSLLIAYEPGDTELPDAEDVLAELSARDLIVVSEGTGYQGGEEVLFLSPLGTALGRSGLELDDADDLARLARLVCDRAGPVDLLWHAFQARSVQKVTAWVALPGLPTSRHSPSMRGSVLTIAMAHCLDPDIPRQDLCLQYIAAEGLALPDRLLNERNRTISAELSAVLESEDDEVHIDDANALLRALVAWEWLNGVPFEEMNRRFGGVVKSKEDPDRGRRNAPGLRLYYADVEQLCEQVAGYLRAVAELCVSQDGVDHSPRVQSLALRVEAGLPTWLAGVSKMRIPALHRERLAKLADQPPLAPLSALVDQERLVSAIDEEEREAARRIIDNRITQRQEFRDQYTNGLADTTVPNAEGDTFLDLLRDMRTQGGATGYLDQLCQAVRGMGVSATDPVVSGDYAVSAWSHPAAGDPLDVRVPLAMLSVDMAGDVAGQPALVVVRSVREGVWEALEDDGIQARFLEPENLLQVLKQLVRDHGQSVAGDVVMAELRAIRVSSFGTG